MKILHTADIHIGEMAFSKVDEESGLNARGLDFLNAFKNISDIALKQKVDVFLVAGDFFTKVNPQARYVLEVMRKLKQISRAGIKTIIVSGNHETPRMTTTLNPLELIGETEGVTVALEPMTIKVDDFDFVCVPSPSNFDDSKTLFDPLLSIALQKSKSENKILVSHIPLGQATACSEVALESFMGECVDVCQIPKKFRYVALGHMHKCQQIQCASKMPIFYSGSTERHEFNEENFDKYALLVDIDKQASVQKIRLTTRPMVTVLDQDCAGLSASVITKKSIEAIADKKGNLKDALVRIKLDNIDLDESRLIDWALVKQELADSKVFDFKIQPTTKVPMLVGSGMAEEYILPPAKELELFVKNKPEYRGKTKLLIKLGNEIIKESREMAT